MSDKDNKFTERTMTWRFCRMDNCLKAQSRWNYKGTPMFYTVDAYQLTGGMSQFTADGDTFLMKYPQHFADLDAAIIYVENHDATKTPQRLRFHIPTKTAKGRRKAEPWRKELESDRDRILAAHDHLSISNRALLRFALILMCQSAAAIIAKHAHAAAMRRTAAPTRGETGAGE